MGADGQQWRERLRQYIRAHALPLEKFGHQPRLYALTQSIGPGLAYDDDVVFAAAWLHDLGVFVGRRPEDPVALARWDSVGDAVREAPAVLREVGFPEGKIAAVLDCIRTHQPQCVPVTLEATILRDADILEQLGAVGVLRTACKVGRDTRFHTFTDAVAALRLACDRLPQQLQLETAQILAEERVRVLRTFLNAIAVEAGDLLY